LDIQNHNYNAAGNLEKERSVRYEAI